MSLKLYPGSILFFFFILISCEPDSIAESEFIEVTYGTVCFCHPYGETTSTFNQNEIIRNKKSNTGNIADKLCTKMMPGGDWNRIIQNLNIGEFIDLPETIGCPNCADEGAQWLKIQTQGSAHQVTWSNREELIEMSVLLTIIDDLLKKHFQGTDCE